MSRQPGNPSQVSLPDCDAPESVRRRPISLTSQNLFVAGFLLSTLVLSPSLVLARPEQAIPKKHPPARATSSGPSRYNDAPLDLTADRLPHNYSGRDPAALYRHLQTPPKGEFETTDAYAARTAYFGNPETFAVLLDDPLRIIAKYDADVEQLEVKVALDVFDNRRSDYSGTAFVLRDTVERRSYIGSNAFGARATIESIRHERYAIVPTNRRFGFRAGGMSSGISRSVYNAWLELTPVRARSLKDSLGAIIVCRIAFDDKPYAASDVHATEATITSPTEVLVEYKYVRARVLQLWLFDRSTGEILLKDTTEATDPQAD